MQPISALADSLLASGVPCFGPTQAAAQLETSKAFAKHFMQRHGVPTPAYEVFSDFAAAKQHILSRPDARVVIKASGLAAGKGEPYAP